MLVLWLWIWWEYRMLFLKVDGTPTIRWLWSSKFLCSLLPYYVLIFAIRWDLEPVKGLLPSYWRFASRLIDQSCLSVDSILVLDKSSFVNIINFTCFAAIISGKWTVNLSPFIKASFSRALSIIVNIFLYLLILLHWSTLIKLVAHWWCGLSPERCCT